MTDGNCRSDKQVCGAIRLDEDVAEGSRDCEDEILI
mgnify:CR=1 FL=1